MLIEYSEVHVCGDGYFSRGVGAAGEVEYFGYGALGREGVVGYGVV